MKHLLHLLLLPFVWGCLGAQQSAGQDRKQPPLTGWAYITADKVVDMMQFASDRWKPLLRLPHGSLLPVYATKTHGARTWLKVQGAEVGTLQAKTGWIKAESVQTFPAEGFPTDAALLSMLGGAYLNESAARTATVARFLMNPQATPVEMVCFIYSPYLPTVLLQDFHVRGGKSEIGPSLSFAASELDTSITSVEFKDLRGDGSICLITKEVASKGAPVGGINLVIRTLGQNSWETLWTAPLELRNLGAFPPKIQVLSPPEKNIGVPGTATRGEVTFQPEGREFIPVWKGKVEFYIPGNDHPTQTVEVQKTCTWQDGRLTPFR